MENIQIMRIENLLIAVATVFLVASCAKPTAESETKKWEANTKTLEMLGAKYPQFKAALQVVKSESAAQWESALKVTGDEQKIEAMQAANTSAYPSFVRDLDNIEDAMEKLKDRCSESTKGGDNSDRESLRNARNDAQRSLSEVGYLLKSRAVNTPVEASALTEEAVKKIANATSRIEKVLRRISDKERKKKAEQKAAEDKSKSEEKAKEEAKNPIKCSYCGTMNNHDALKCSSCGAPVEK